MKTCRSGLHQYESGDRCPECRKATNLAWAKKNRQQLSNRTTKWKAENPALVGIYRLKDRSELSNSYIATCIKLPVAFIPIELIEATRISIKLKRLLKDKKHEVTE